MTKHIIIQTITNQFIMGRLVKEDESSISLDEPQVISVEDVEKGTSVVLHDYNNMFPFYEGTVRKFVKTSLASVEVPNAQMVGLYDRWVASINAQIAQAQPKFIR